MFMKSLAQMFMLFTTPILALATPASFYWALFAQGWWTPLVPITITTIAAIWLRASGMTLYSTAMSVWCLVVSIAGVVYFVAGLCGWASIEPGWPLMLILFGVGMTPAIGDD